MSLNQMHPPAGQPPIVDTTTAPEPALTVIEILLKRKGTVALWAVLALVLGGLYFHFTPPVYLSTAEVFIEKNGDGGPISPMSPTGLSASTPTTHAALLVSTPVLRAALADPAVADNQTLAKATDPVLALRKLLKVKASEEGETMSVSLKSKYPQEIAPIVNAVISAYLDAQQPGASQVLMNPEAATQANAPYGLMADQMQAARLMKLSEQYTQAEADAGAAKMRIELAQQSPQDVARLTEIAVDGGIDLNSIGLSDLAFLSAELSRLKQMLRGMPDSWGPEHQLRGPIERQAKGLADEIAQYRGYASQALFESIQAAHTRAAQQRDQLAKTLENEKALALGTTQLPVKVIEPAQVPVKPHGPKLAKTMAIALFLGIGLGAFFALQGEMKSRDYTAFQGSTPETALPQVTGATALTLQSQSALALPGSSPLALPGPAAESLDVPLLGSVPMIPVSQRLTSPKFEASASAIHQIRAVLQVQAGKNGTMAFAFTSPRQGAGKTSVTIGVATSLAMSGTRTLVVDCDLAGRILRGQTGQPVSDQPVASGRAINDDFGPINSHGSSPENVSIDKIALEQGYLNESDTQAVGSPVDGGRVGVTGMLDGGTLQECLVSATVDGLSLLPAVAAQARHISLMSDRFIRRLLEEAREQFDVVLFDTGPVPGSVEALLVTSQVDGVVLVVPEGESQASLAKTMSYLKVVDAKIAGTVHNLAPAPQAAPEANGEVTSPAEDDDQDFEDMASEKLMGSGILAAAVFSDVESGYASENWALKATSEEPENNNEDIESSVFNGSVDELFATASVQAGDDDDDV